jgi:hypothetical protein
MSPNTDNEMLAEVQKARQPVMDWLAKSLAVRQTSVKIKDIGRTIWYSVNLKTVCLTLYDRHAGWDLYIETPDGNFQYATIEEAAAHCGVKP